MPILYLLGFYALSLSTIASSAPPASAFGALAVGECDRHGFSYDWPSEQQAKQVAIKHCVEKGDLYCEVVETVERACAGFAVSGACGPRGWGKGRTRNEAQQKAVEICKLNGGEECTLTAWVCDAR